MLITNELGTGETVCHLLRVKTSKPPIWSWWSIVIDVGSQCGPVPRTSVGT